MTALLTPPPVAAPVRAALKSYRLTVRDFHDLMETGRFEGRRPILINGEILEQGPMNPPHAIAVNLTVRVLTAVFGMKYHLRVDQPLLFGSYTDPKPDLAVVPGDPRDYKVHPSVAALVVEVSDTSLRFDRSEKAELYATAGVGDYWVLDVVGRKLHVFRNPADGQYAEQKAYAPDAAVAPLLAPDKPVRVADLLP